jgi:hypothetical protein
LKSGFDVLKELSRTVDMKEMAERGPETWLIHQRFEERLNRFTGVSLCIVLLVMYT